MSRDRHDRTGTIGHQYVVGDPDRNLLVVDRIDRIGTGKDTGLILVQFRSFHFGFGSTGFLIGFNFRFLFCTGDLVYQRMFRRKNTICCAEQRIASCCEDRETFIVISDPEYYFRTDRFTDPVTLYFLGRFRPVDRLKVFQKSFGICRDIDDPLLHVLAYDRIAASFRLAIDHFIIGQYTAKFLTPVYRHFQTLGIAIKEELFEDPLRPFVIVRIRCGNDL